MSQACEMLICLERLNTTIWGLGMHAWGQVCVVLSENVAADCNIKYSILTHTFSQVGSIFPQNNTPRLKKKYKDANLPDQKFLIH